MDWDEFAANVLARLEDLEAEVARLKSSGGGGGGGRRGGGGFPKKKGKPGEAARLAAEGKMPFGKHMGKPVSELAETEDGQGYLQWLYDQHLTGEFELREPLLGHVEAALNPDG
jgi:uncharacterized protein (DUF3820 family)